MANRKRIERLYGISLEYYNTLREVQKFRCAICRIPESKLGEPLVIDHDHSNGEVRGLLCSKCNLGLGLFKDSPKRLLRAAMYVYAKSQLTGFVDYVKNIVGSMSANDILNVTGSRDR